MSGKIETLEECESLLLFLSLSMPACSVFCLSSLQEVQRMQRIIMLSRKNLTAVIDAIDGLIIMTPDLQVLSCFRSLSFISLSSPGPLFFHRSSLQWP